MRHCDKVGKPGSLDPLNVAWMNDFFLLAGLFLHIIEELMGSSSSGSVEEKGGTMKRLFPCLCRLNYLHKKTWPFLIRVGFTLNF